MDDLEHGHLTTQEPSSRRRAIDRAAASLLLPGLGQFGQRRFTAGAIQMVTVVGYLIASVGLGAGRAILLAAAWNVWSAVDAYWHEP